MRVGRGVIWLKSQLGAQMGQRPTTTRAKEESEGGGGAPKPPGHAGRLGPRAGARGAGPAVAPPRAGGEEGGRRRRREGGDRTCLVSPRAPRAIPPPTPRHQAREGKGGEGGRGGRTLGFPQPPREELRVWGPGSPRLALRSPPAPFRKRRLLPPRVAPTWGFLTHTSSVFLPRSCRVAPTHLSPYGSTAHSAFCLPSRGHGSRSLLPAWHGPSLLCLLPGPPFPRLSRRSINPFPRPSILGFLGPRFLRRASFSQVRVRNTQGASPRIPGTPTGVYFPASFLHPTTSRPPFFPACITPPRLSL